MLKREEKKTRKNEPENNARVSKVSPRIVADYTSASLKGIKYPPISDFDWGCGLSDKERIIKNSIDFANIDLREAFASAYGLKIKKSKEKSTIFGEVSVGDVIPLKVVSIDKKGAHFESDSFKEEIVCAVNLYQYRKFKNFIPSKPLNCKVVSKTENRITVDPLAPMYDEWLKMKINTIDEQYNVKHDRSIVVRDLKLTRGGYFGAIRIDNVSNFLGQDVCIRGFIPGSQIVLNIENDFEKWNGKSVKAFITNYISDGPNDRTSLICSAKSYLSFIGDKNKIELFKEYTEDSEDWQKELSKEYDGVITGVINSSKKCGVFVEVPELSITTMVNCKPDQLVNYRKNTSCKVKWLRFDENTYYNESLGQMQHKAPYVIEDDILKKCSIKAIFEFVK